MKDNREDKIRKAVAEWAKNGDSDSIISVPNGAKIDELLSTPMKVFWRVFYGTSEIKPNDHCYWDDGIYSDRFGWVENDDHFKSRIKSELNQ